MALDIRFIAKRLNALSRSHRIGQLQDIRKQLKNLKRRAGKKIFSEQTSFEKWAFHHGGRKELQFNIGYANDANDDLRYGVAFSFKLSQTLQSLDELVPKVKFFNDFIEMNAEAFGDMRMWHYDPQRSEDRLPGPIPSSLTTVGVFVFLGNRQPNRVIDYDRILDDFDRLLPLYLYVESGGATAPVPESPQSGFVFKPGFSQKVKAAKATFAEKELDLDLRHNFLQQELYKRLVAKYGKGNVRTEQPSGVGTLIDIVVKVEDQFWFYEIKTALTPRACLRESLGQLLEYGFWPGSKEPSRFIVVGISPLDEDGQEYLRRLKQRFSLPVEYQALVL